jgi:hypothetical protein
MDWYDKLTWKNCIVSTSICLVGCSIGSMGVALFLTSINFFFILLISLVAGLISCILFMIIWLILAQKMNFMESLKSSLKMSVVSMLIMMTTENLFVFFIIPKLYHHNLHANSTHNFMVMIIAMFFGFLFSLPYNYYHIQKTGQICH